jgi:hypothetical protein
MSATRSSTASPATNARGTTIPTPIASAIGRRTIPSRKPPRCFPPKPANRETGSSNGDQLPAVIEPGTLTTQTDTYIVPALVADLGGPAAWGYVEFFTANIRNPNTRRAYARAYTNFFAWCDERGLTLTTIRPHDVATYIETRHQNHSAPDVKQQLAAVRILFDWLITGQIVPVNPAAAVRGPKHVVKTGKTAVLDAKEVAQVTQRLEQEVRYDQFWQYRGNGQQQNVFDGGKGLELIPTATNEVLINPPAYQERVNAKHNVYGWLDDQFLVVKQRLLSANEQQGNYIVSAFLGVTAPSGNAAFTNGAWAITPTLAGGKGWGNFDIRATAGISLLTRNQSSVGGSIATNIAFQYHFLEYFWPELEVNHTPQTRRRVQEPSAASPQRPNQVASRRLS